MTEGTRQQQAQLAPVDEGELKKKPHQLLPGLIAAAFEENDPDLKEQLAGPVIDALIAMRAPGDEAEEAPIVLAHLEAKTLRGLKDENDRDAHAEAVETLLSLGFPHALKISPEDLAHFRSHEGKAKLGGPLVGNRRARDVAAALAAAGQLAALAVQATSSRTGGDYIAFASAGAGLAGAYWLFKSKPLLDRQVGPLSMMTVSALGGLLAASAIGLGGLWGPLLMIPAILVAFFGQKPE